MVDNFDKNFEKNKLPDRSEKLSDQHKKINKKLYDFDSKVQGTVSDVEHEFLTIPDEETLAAMTSLKDKIKENIPTQEILKKSPNSIHDDGRVVNENENKTSPTHLTPSIKQAIEKNSEDLLSVQGRQNSYDDVASFAHSVGQEQGFLGRATNNLS